MRTTDEESTKRRKHMRGSVLLFVCTLSQYLVIRHLPLPIFGPTYWAVHAVTLGLIIYAYILMSPFIQEEEQKRAEWKKREKAELDAANAFIYGTDDKKD